MAKIISIDTSDNEKIVINLDINGKKDQIYSESILLKSEATMPLIDKILRKNKISLNELDGIRVNTGPGSFTGLRVGVSIANALGYLLKIPVNGKKVGQLSSPVYNK